eukprot:TRINITY_DN31862_c0_g1_i1.p2 TRINITY_DN31862_c0_g1~~TRINITY_DN31862_c0_g1_i1.p2  ORF type:complete len:257 (+),score=58.38 TRINITY_DN31862_c0_g1_i1:26-772(+)
MLKRLWSALTGSTTRLGSDAEEAPSRSSAKRPAPTPVKEVKLLLVGDGEVGKTTFVKRHLTGEFLTRYKPTEGFEMTKLRVNTSSGQVQFNVWDTAGQDRHAGLGDAYYIGADCAIVFFDVTRRETVESAQQLLQKIRKVAGDVPTVMVGNKVDVASRVVKAKDVVNIMRRLKVQYYDLSLKSQFNVEKPLLWLARKLLDAPQLRLTGDVAARPDMPSAPVNAERQSAARELELARRVPIANDDDDDL